MAATPVRRWLIDDIGTLSESSFRADLALVAHAFTLTLWFREGRTAGKQVIARLNPPDVDGWSLALLDGCLVAEYGTAEAIHLRVTGPEVAADQWTFAALTAEAETQALRLSDGRHTAIARLDASNHAFNLTGIIVGGYTDPAGGHYDHTFGRDGRGLVDAVCLHDCVLTEGELAQLAEVTGETPGVRLAFTADQMEAPSTVRFRAEDAHDARSFVWSFGDGASAVGREAAHHYSRAGEYTVRLTALGDGHRQIVAETILAFGGAAEDLERTPVFVNGSEGYACYRIPSIVCAANGDLLAFAEGRRDSCSDSTPVIHIVSKRSTDGGRSWEPLQVVAQHGEKALMNASPVVDAARGTGRVVLLYNLMTANEWALARGEGRNQTLCTTSDDHGRTWSAPRDISQQIGRPDWRIQRPTLGHAVQRPDGRIIHASTITIGAASVFESQNVLVWSDDLGESWRYGEPCPTIGLNEAAAVVLGDGCVLINSRAYIGGQPTGCRAITRACFIAGGGVQYRETTYHPTLIDPAVQASTLRVTTERGPAILFANPAHPEARKRLTLRASFDGGATWPAAREIDGGPSSYSDLVLQADGRVGILYERGNQGGIALVSVTLDWLWSGQPE